MYRLTKYRVSLVKDSSHLIDGNKRISTAEDVAAAAQDMRSLDREQLRTYFLNAGNRIIGWEIVSQGTLTASLAHPREILKGAILAGCAAIILVHNHPSGECQPSDEDKRLTLRLRQACDIIGISLADHVIMAENGVYSFKQMGAL